MTKEYTSAERAPLIRRVLIVELVLNMVVATAKGVYGVWSGSLAITTDAVHSAVDAASNVVGLVVVTMAGKPPDEKHPYGHYKLEVIASAVIGVAIAATGLRFAWSAIDALISNRAAPSTSVIGFVVICGTWAVNVFIATWEARKARELDSSYLAADAAHTASDVIVTGAVLASYTAAHFGVAWADPVGALAVLVIIGGVAWRILSPNLHVLVDGSALDVSRIEPIATAVPGVLGCHRVRSRGSAAQAHIDLHLQLDGKLSLRAAHQIAHKVEDALRAELGQGVDVTIHMEPDDHAAEAL